MQYVADTNIWYNIADNIIDPKELIKDGNELYATPINIIEIAATTKISYATKKSIFKAIQEYKKGILPEPMCHLASLLGYDNIKEETDIWIKIVNQFLNSQIVPHDSLIFKKLNDHYHSFSKSIDGFNNSNVPGHSLANNKCNVTTDEDKERYKIMCQSKQFEDVIYISLHQTIKEYIFNDLKIQSKKSKTKIYPLVEPYIKARMKYILNCAIKYKTRPNDYADMLNFLYLQKGRILLTNDRRWLNIAKETGYSHMVTKPYCPIINIM